MHTICSLALVRPCHELERSKRFPKWYKSSRRKHISIHDPIRSMYIFILLFLCLTRNYPKGPFFPFLYYSLMNPKCEPRMLLMPLLIQTAHVQ